VKVIRRRWTETDDSILRQQYDHTREGTQRIASRLDRTPAAVKERAVSLGITKPGHSRRAWSEQDDEMLVQLLGHYQPRTVATKMKRSISSVRARAAKLGASARMRDGWYTQSEAAAILGVDHHWITARIHSKALKAKRHDAFTWHIEATALRAFVVAHASELRGRKVDVEQFVWVLTA
jgi:hypothetical protein